MTAAGLEHLANVQLRSWPRGADERQVEERAKMLAGHLLVLRFFGSVQRRAAQSGLPVPAHTQVGVQRRAIWDHAISPTGEVTFPVDDEVWERIERIREPGESDSAVVRKLLAAYGILIQEPRPS